MRKSTAPAISVGRPIRPSGTPTIRHCARGDAAPCAVCGRHQARLRWPHPSGRARGQRLHVGNEAGLGAPYAAHRRRATAADAMNTCAAPCHLRCRDPGRSRTRDAHSCRETNSNCRIHVNKTRPRANDESTKRGSRELLLGEGRQAARLARLVTSPVHGIPMRYLARCPGTIGVDATHKISPGRLRDAGSLSPYPPRRRPVVASTDRNKSTSQQGASCLRRP